MKITFILTLLVSLFGLPQLAFADSVDYDDIDAMAFRMTAQIEEVQACDQSLRVYHQVLAFDEEQYATNFNQDALVASMLAGGIAWAYDDGTATTEEVRVCVESLGVFALDLYGYAEGSMKYNALRNAWYWLGKAWHCYWKCALEYWAQVWKCVDGTTGRIVQFVGTALGAVGAGAWALGALVLAKILSIAAAVLIGGLAVLCILLHLYEFYKCYFDCIMIS